MALGKFKLSLKDYEIVGTSPLTGEIFFSMFRDIPFSRKFTVSVYCSSERCFKGLFIRNINILKVNMIFAVEKINLYL